LGGFCGGLGALDDKTMTGARDQFFQKRTQEDFLGGRVDSRFGRIRAFLRFEGWLF
jgi:hypothetical protein